MSSVVKLMSNKKKLRIRLGVRNSTFAIRIGYHLRIPHHIINFRLESVHVMNGV